MNISAWLSDSLSGEFVLTALISMLPVVELRGGIPFGISTGLPVYLAVISSVLGNMLPVPFLILFTRRVFEWMRHHIPRLDGLIVRLEKRAETKSQFVQSSKFWGLLILVAIPLPGTGAWTGAIIAALLDIRMSRALPAICVGVLIAGIIITLATAGVVHLVV